MCDMNQTLPKDNPEVDSEDNSDDNLKIVLDTPSPRRKILRPKPSEREKRIIESIEDELERRLGEKAAKTNLNAHHVKNIIKHVVSNEHVLALVKKAENPNECDESFPFEPKLTRAKAKELSTTLPIPSVAWSTPKSTSEVQVLFSEDLQEDSSGDEYIPGEDESEDDRDGSIISDPPSVPPPTPPSPPHSSDNFTQTNWSEDGVFKIPQAKTKEESEEEANIALRTRSKLCLSSTPLEVIEEAFIPPDITTDMYDMECDNDDWKDFLKKFTRPLDEIAKATEDEEHDPEYNILADEEVDEVDKEELRVDKAVKVSRKELSDLIAELFEYTELYGENSEMDEDKNNCSVDIQQNISGQSEVFEASDTSKCFNGLDKPADKSNLPVKNIKILENILITPAKTTENILIFENQLPLLEQQMRQHVQLLTQNFLLTYHHPELHECSLKSKEYLLNLKFLYEGKDRSMFYTINLNDALNLVEHWEGLLASDSEAVQKMKSQVEKTIAQTIQRKQAGTIYQYVPEFPDLILETISNSIVFLYPSLLPKLPFASPRIHAKLYGVFTDSENQLIAMGLEQFVPVVATDPKNLMKNGDIRFKVVAHYIQEYMMPHRDSIKLYHHIITAKSMRCSSNPIQYYFKYNKAPPTFHYVYSLEELKILPPSKRTPDELPHQWKMFNYPQTSELSSKRNDSVPVPNKLQPQVCSAPLKINTNILSKGPIILTPIALSSIPVWTRTKRTRRKQRPVEKNRLVKGDPITNFVKCLSRPSQIQKLLKLYTNDLDQTTTRQEEPKSANLSENPSKTKPQQKSPRRPKRRKILISAKVPEHSGKTKSQQKLLQLSDMLPSMPHLCTPIKTHPQNEVLSSANSSNSEDKNAKSAESISSTSKGETRQVTQLEYSTISSISFQQADTSTEVEFCKQAGGFKTVTTTCKNDDNLQNSAASEKENSASHTNTTESHVDESSLEYQEKDSPVDINALMVASSNTKPSTKKEPSGAEKKRAKIKREFLANLSVSTPEDPEVEKQKNEMFALAYYDKMRETLDLDDYHKIMQILNDHEEGDAVDLYNKVERVLRPKYQELADEFLLFLREKEAAAVGQLIPWMRMNNRSKFLRKLETYFKDQPSQLRKIYKCLTELSQTVDVSIEKIKTTLLPMFKGNAVLSDLFLQNFLDERPPPSLLEGPYETIDINKEMARPDEEEIYENIVVPDIEDKYGGASCICNCHQIEDPEFKTRYRHCIRCGTRFINGKVYIQTGRGLRPATVSFLTSPNKDNNVRLMGKASNTLNQRKKRSDSSPSKHVTLSPTKENADEESEDDVDGKKKPRRKAARKRKRQQEAVNKDSRQKSTVAKKRRSDSVTSGNSNLARKEVKGGTKKRASYVRKSRAKEKKTDKDAAEKILMKEEEVFVKGEIEIVEEPLNWEENAIACESSSDMKPNSPGQNTAESESEFCEESSQDNCESDSNSSISSSNNHSQSDSNAGEEGLWKREEDKIILETFQKENDKEHAFKIISNKLKTRNVAQISNRFQTLMTLLLETLGNS